MSTGAKQWDHLILNVNLATMAGQRAYGAIEQAALAIVDQQIAWLGPMAELPAAPEGDGGPEALAVNVHRFGGMWCTPGLIDCHTHLLFAGTRAHEFEQRLNGASYEEIAAAGGGIASTVKATSEASDRELMDLAGGRLQQMLAQGATTVEIKSGYGLDLEGELRLLRIARRLDERFPVSITTTLLGLHAIPPSYQQQPDDYVSLVCDKLLPAAINEGLVDAVDAYCESIAFSPQQIRRLFTRARNLAVPVKLHADQLSAGGGAELAAEFAALSADHLEYTSPAGVAAMAAAGCVAVLLPGAYFTLGQAQQPPLQDLRDHDVPIAVATDCNPGTSPVASLLTVMNQACSLFGLTPEEALRGATLNAARALGRDHHLGSLEVGKQADLALWDIQDPAELSWWIGGRRCKHLFKLGEQVY